MFPNCSVQPRKRIYWGGWFIFKKNISTWVLLVCSHKKLWLSAFESLHMDKYMSVLQLFMFCLSVRTHLCYLGKNCAQRGRIVGVWTNWPFWKQWHSLIMDELSWEQLKKKEPSRSSSSTIVLLLRHRPAPSYSWDAPSYVHAKRTGRR